MRKGLALAAGIGLLAQGELGWAQRSPNWRTFKLADGLPESACAAVTLSTQGKTLVRHLASPVLSELDGYTHTRIPGPDLAIGRIYQSPGGQLWAVSSGGLKESREGNWIFHPVPEIAAHFRVSDPSKQSAVPLFPVRQGLVFFLLPGSLFSYDQLGPARTHLLREAIQTGLGRFVGMNLGADGALWVSGLNGLAKIVNPRAPRADVEWQVFLIPPELQVTNLREPHADAAGLVTMAAERTTNGQPIAVIFDGKTWKIHEAGNERLLHVWPGPDNTFWAVTKNTLLQWTGDDPGVMENDEVSARQYFDVAVEPTGAFWLATSDGLFRYAPLIWRSPASVRTIKTPVNCLTADRDGRVWFIAAGGLHLVDREVHREFPFPTTLASALSAATALFPARNGSLLIESEEELFSFHQSAGFSRTQANGDRFKVLGLLPDGNLCVQRLGPKDSREAAPNGLEMYDGSQFDRLSQPLPEETAGARFLALFAAKSGDVWLCWDKGTAWLHDNKWKVFTSLDGSTPEEVTSFAEVPDGKTWCAAPDRIWEFDGRNWLTVRRGFDRISSMLRMPDRSVWVASSGGLQRFLQGDWIENGTEEGLASSAVRALCEDQSGRLWAATSHGLDWYCPEADTDPPRASIEVVSEEDKSLAEGQSFNVAFSGIDKWKFTQQARLLYSFRLDQKEWSPFQETPRASFSDLAAGKHYFQVRSMDRNCNIDQKPQQMEFAVVLPWYREKRLVLISGAGLVAVVFFAWLAFNRHLHLLRSYSEIEKKVAQRTRELEMANRELLHSQKMTALGTLAAGIAHDFNNILSIIKGSAQVIEENLQDAPKIHTRVDRIKTVVEQGSGIVKAMLGFSRESDEAPGLCDLNLAVEDTMKLLGDRFLREVRVTFQPGNALVPVRCSKDFIQQILLNFIFNSADSMSKGKLIKIITTQSDTLPTGMALMPAQARRYEIVTVEDSGCGISPENLPRVFEPFFTTKAFSTRRGTGLGLSMVYELAKKMDAGLAVESVVDQGSRFSLILPLRENGAAAPPPGKSPEVPVAQR